jgi:hypothetical protein
VTPKFTQSLLIGHTDGDLVPVLTSTATKFTIPPDQWTKTRPNKNLLSTLRRPPAQMNLHQSKNMFVVRVLPWISVISCSDAPQNVSYTLGITTRPFHSGQDFASSQFSPMKSKPSKRLLWCIRSSRRGTQSCVINYSTLLSTCQRIHRKTIKEAQSQTGWLETCSRTIGHDGGKGTSLPHK